MTPAENLKKYGRRLNWKPSRPCPRRKRALMLSEFSGKTIAQLPDSVSLIPLAAPVKDQGKFGACSGFSSCVTDEFLQLMEIRAKLPEGQAPQEFIEGKFQPGSPMFIYNGERIKEGTLSQDAGATTLGDACDVLTTFGLCREVTFPYKRGNLFKKPTPTAYREAALHKVRLSYALDQDAQQLMQCLANGFPFVFGMVVGEDMMSEAVAKSGIVNPIQPNEKIVGGHALCCVGYEVNQYWEFQNSWGLEWGMKGFGRIPWDTMLDPNLSDDQFTLRYEGGT